MCRLLGPHTGLRGKWGPAHVHWPERRWTKRKVLGPPGSAPSRKCLLGKGQGLLGFISLRWATLGLPAMLNHTEECRGADEMRKRGESVTRKRDWAQGEDTLSPEGSRWDFKQHQPIPVRPWARASLRLAS